MNVDKREIITTLKKHGRHHASRALLTSKRNARIVFSGSAFFYIDEKGVYRPLRGLLPVLKSTFWPNSNIYSIMKKVKPSSGIKKASAKQAGAKHNAKRANAKQATAKQPKQHSKGRFFGSIQGSRIHGELDDFITFDGEAFLKRHPQMHPWTKRILLYVMTEMHWYPLECEFKLYDETLRIGTAIDMICVNPHTGHLIFLEFKTGYKTYFEQHDGFMKRCLCFMPNSPLNWANIQLTSAVLMLLKQWPTIPLAHTASYVIRIDDENLVSYHIDNQFIQRMSNTLLQNVDVDVVPRQ
jgi:hypothetical protein